MVLDGSGYLSQLVHLNVAQFVNWATSFFAEFQRVSGFPKSSRVDQVREPSLFSPPLLEFDLFFRHLPRSHLVQSLQSSVRLQTQALLSQQVTAG